jgi:zinc/manganese transport system substrate-binding protein
MGGEDVQATQYDVAQGLSTNIAPGGGGMPPVVGGEAIPETLNAPEAEALGKEASVGITSATGVYGSPMLAEGEEEDHAAEEEDHATEEDGHDHDHAHGNEHVWYDFHVVEDFATRLADQLKTLDPDNAAQYTANLEEFLVGIESLEERAAVVAGSVSGAKVISSEPVADYLLAELGLTNITPESFSQAIEEELDVSPADLLEIQNLISTNSVDLFVVNIQTGSVQIDALVELAEANGVAVIQVSELLPEGLGYLAWMEQNISAIEAGLK